MKYEEIDGCLGPLLESSKPQRELDNKTANWGEKCIKAPVK